MLDSILFITSPQGWLIAGVIVLVLFGGQKIPEMMRGLGSGVKEFKKGIRDEEEDEKSDEKSDEKKEKDSASKE